MKLLIIMDYASVGLKCGLEIHQQLDATKLFCSCPTALHEEQPDFTVSRELHAVPGERGEVDVAAMHESLKGKRFFYEGYDDATCLVELDEEPPHPLNSDALKAAVEVSLMLKAKVLDVIQVMRKTVIDGSNTSGFQRTALISHSGTLSTSDGPVSITTICVEEDSARIVKEEQDAVTYCLDRLGIPLIEIATGPDIRSPKQCLEAAETLGMVLRSTGKVKRGLGTIRQDVNVSIKDGARVEIKGAQELRMLPQLVEYEALRQSNLLRIMGELKKRRPTLQKRVQYVTELFKTTQSKIIKSAIDNGSVVLGLKLHAFASLIGTEIQPNRRLGTEFSERAKVKAGVGGIFHSDELPAYGITKEEIKSVRDKLGCKSGDGFVLVAAEKNRAEKALDAVFERAQEALLSVPSEVRKPNQDGTTSYLRPMPGAARMYPETDVPLIVPDTRKIRLPELIDAKIKRFVKEYGLSPDLAENIAKSERVSLFEELVHVYKDIKPAYIAETLTARLTEIRRDYNLNPENISDENLRIMFNALSDGKLHKDVMLDTLIDAAKGKVNINFYATLSTEELHKEIQSIISENKGAPFSALMGIAVKRLKGKASGQKISEMLTELLNGHKNMKAEHKVK